MVGFARPGSSLTRPLNSCCTARSPRPKSSSTPRSAKPLNRSIDARRLATKSPASVRPPVWARWRASRSAMAAAGGGGGGGEPLGGGGRERVERPAADHVAVVGAGWHDEAPVLVAGGVV